MMQFSKGNIDSPDAIGHNIENSNSNGGNSLSWDEVVGVTAWLNGGSSSSHSMPQQQQQQQQQNKGNDCNVREIAKEEALKRKSAEDEEKKKREQEEKEKLQQKKLIEAKEEERKKEEARLKEEQRQVEKAKKEKQERLKKAKQKEKLKKEQKIAEAKAKAAAIAKAKANEKLEREKQEIAKKLAIEKRKKQEEEDRRIAEEHARRERIEKKRHDDALRKAKEELLRYQAAEERRAKAEAERLAKLESEKVEQEEKQENEFSTMNKKKSKKKKRKGKKGKTKGNQSTNNQNGKKKNKKTNDANANAADDDDDEDIDALLMEFKVQQEKISKEQNSNDDDKSKKGSRVSRLQKIRLENRVKKENQQIESIRKPRGYDVFDNYFNNLFKRHEQNIWKAYTRNEMKALDPYANRPPRSLTSGRLEKRAAKLGVSANKESNFIYEDGFGKEILQYLTVRLDNRYCSEEELRRRVARLYAFFQCATLIISSKLRLPDNSPEEVRNLRAHLQLYDMIQRLASSVHPKLYPIPEFIHKNDTHDISWLEPEDALLRSLDSTLSCVLRSTTISDIRECFHKNCLKQEEFVSQINLKGSFQDIKIDTIVQLLVEIIKFVHGFITFDLLIPRLSMTSLDLMLCLWQRLPIGSQVRDGYFAKLKGLVDKQLNAFEKQWTHTSQELLLRICGVNYKGCVENNKTLLKHPKVAIAVSHLGRSVLESSIDILLMNQKKTIFDLLDNTERPPELNLMHEVLGSSIKRWATVSPREKVSNFIKSMEVCISCLWKAKSVHECEDIMINYGIIPPRDKKKMKGVSGNLIRGRILHILSIVEFILTKWNQDGQDCNPYEAMDLFNFDILDAFDMYIEGMKINVPHYDATVEEEDRYTVDKESICSLPETVVKRLAMRRQVLEKEFGVTTSDRSLKKMLTSFGVNGPNASLASPIFIRALRRIDIGCHLEVLNLIDMNILLQTHLRNETKDTIKLQTLLVMTRNRMRDITHGFFTNKERTGASKRHPICLKTLSTIYSSKWNEEETSCGIHCWHIINHSKLSDIIALIMEDNGFVKLNQETKNTYDVINFDKDGIRKCLSEICLAAVVSLVLDFGKETWNHLGELGKFIEEALIDRLKEMSDNINERVLDMFGFESFRDFQSCDEVVINETLLYEFTDLEVTLIAMKLHDLMEFGDADGKGEDGKEIDVLSSLTRHAEVIFQSAGEKSTTPREILKQLASVRKSNEEDKDKDSTSKNDKRRKKIKGR
eukprot:TRINITY_DN425_c1_g1_i1.p1 TRINITY_DN425_c1_g1~~TRINITY_DN425_c1_g1_i1.p1  ORF type:complete len:1303 (-),score=470.74 TRINITY_DN425_c1_g1_i1:179-3916(-)